MNEQNMLNVYVREAILVRNMDKDTTIKQLKDRYSEDEIENEWFKVLNGLDEVENGL